MNGTYALPEFHMPFPAALNPALARTTPLLWQWIDEFRLADEHRGRERLRAAGLDRLAAWIHPTADAAMLLLVAQWMVWFFQLDDQFDDGPAGRDLDRCDAAIAELRAACEALAGNSPLTRATTDLIERTSTGRSAAWLRRFTRNTSDYLDSYRVEAEHRAAGYHMGLDEYLRHRRRSDAMEMCLDLTELVAGVELDDDVHAGTHFTIARNAANIIPALTNDIFSFPKEFHANYFNNAVYIACRSWNLAPHEAVRKINNLITREVDDLLQSGRALRGDRPGVDEVMRTGAMRCVEEFGHWVSGFLAWSRESRRYREFEQVPTGTTPSYVENLLDVPVRSHSPERQQP